LTIGITGHQKLSDEVTIKWLTRELIYEYKRLKYVACAYSSLAIGADQLFAKNILELETDLIAVIPCMGYEKTFKESHKNRYFAILSQCKLIETLDFAEPSELAFLAAGKHVVNKSDVLFAIWDGDKAKGLGGTGDIVQYALSLKKSVIHLNPVSRIKIIHNRQIRN
jgi:hypothetical protein